MEKENICAKLKILHRNYCLLKKNKKRNTEKKKESDRIQQRHPEIVQRYPY